MDPGEIEGWLKLGVGGTLVGTGLFLIVFLVRKLWATLWEGTTNQNDQLRKDLETEKANTEVLKALAKAELKEMVTDRDAWEAAYHQVYFEYYKLAPATGRLPWKGMGGNVNVSPAALPNAAEAGQAPTP